jgi:hypothetical protein
MAKSAASPFALSDADRASFVIIAGDGVEGMEGAKFGCVDDKAYPYPLGCEEDTDGSEEAGEGARDEMEGN